MAAPSSSAQIPPRRIALPTSTTFVFSSSRNPRPASATPPIDQFALPHRPPPSPSTAAPRTRAVLREHQLVRHGAGAQDVRAALVYGRTPAGFVPFDAPPPPAEASVDHNPFFPPVVVVGASAPPQPKRAPLPTVDECFAPRTASPAPSAHSRASTRSSTATARATPSTHSSVSSLSTLVSSTDGAPPRAPATRRTASYTRSTALEPGLSLTELFAADWISSAPASGSSSRRRERRTKENVDTDADVKVPARAKTDGDVSPRKTPSPDLKAPPTRPRVKTVRSASPACVRLL
jgi:hypothetical protein